jgi:hypothetical protein
MPAATPSRPNPIPGGGHDPELDWINKEWDQLPNEVKLRILKIIRDSL